ncbi:hypothetical protein CMO90_01840 [Candidatus Woesearchaeota archaeon]|jgi:hypothetical protein|nr:hypothetical protein [Candidatus Woesearchaeota archaeon]|tara:strand:+ start:2383 stop:2646 length:264 start_codon:yes stop_codon:yes gene_type:complete
MELIKLIENLSIEELEILMTNLKDGTIKTTIENKLERFKNKKRVCPVCNTLIGDEGLELIFGSSNFRKKAVFDGTDCLEYFISKIRK